MIMSRGVRFYETGDAGVLKIEELEERSPQAGEVKIKVAAIGLNRSDIMFRTGQYIESPVFPSRLGYEASGVIEALGPGVEGLAVGQKVSTIPAFSMGEHGVYGEKAIVPAHAVAAYPSQLSSEEATSIWMAYVTAYGALVEYGKLQAEDSLLITAASSSVGLATIQLAKAIGAKVIATTRTDDKAAGLLAAGADKVVNTSMTDWTDQVLQATKGQGVSLAFDPIGGAMLSKLGEVTATGGMIIEYGALAHEETVYPLFAALAKGLTIKGYTLFEITKSQEKLSRAKAYVLDALNHGLIKPKIDKVFPFEEVQAAHQYMESNGQMGKIILKL